MPKIDLSVEIAGIKLRSPLIMASSPITMDGKTIKRISKYGAGAAVTKTILPAGAINWRPAMSKTTHGLINCERWSDLTPDEWIEKEIKIAKEANIPIIASVGAGHRRANKKDFETRMEITRRVTDAGAAAIEVPAYDPADVVSIIPEMRKNTDLPIFGKLALWSFHIEPYINAAIKAGIDAVTCIDSIGPALVIDIEKENSVLGAPNGLGRISGPTIKPFGLYAVYGAYKKFSKPIIGCGGVSSAKDVIEYVMAGARATQLCTASMIKGPTVFEKINNDLIKWLKDHDYSSLRDVQGALHRRIGIREKENQVSFDANPPNFVKARCTSCGTCAKVCPYIAIEMKMAANGKEYPLIDNSLCYGCGLCISSCPVTALESPYEIVK